MICLYKVWKQPISYIINLALQTLVICPLSITEYLTSENLAEMVSDISNILSNVQSTGLSRKLKASVQSLATDSNFRCCIFKML